MPYIGRSTDGFGVRNRFLYLASASDTSVSGADANGATLSFSDGAYVDVYLNGVLLKAGTDYNTNTANTIAGISSMSANDEVTVIVYDVFTVGDMVSATSGGTFTGAVTFNGGVTGDLSLTSTDAGASSAPNLTFLRNSSSPAVNDVMGRLSFKGKNDADEEVEYAYIESVIADETDGTEDGKLFFAFMKGGSQNVHLNMAGNADTKFQSKDVQLVNVDFKAKGNEIFLDADDDTSITADTDDRIDFKTGGSDRMKINSNGSVGIASDVTTSDLNIGAGVGSYATIQMTPGGTSTGNIIYFGDSGDADYSSITSFGSGAGENGRMRFIVGTREALNIFNDADITSTGSRFKLGAAGAKTVISPGTGVTVTLADDATFSVAGYSGSSSAMLLVYDAGGGGGMFFHTYQSTVTKIAGVGDYVTSETDGNTCVHKASNNHAVSLTNKEGASVNYYIMIVAAYD